MLNIRALESHIMEQMGASGVPGAALAIVEGDSVIYAQGFGQTTAADFGVLVTPETLFRIGSTTKPLTGTAIMRLVELGLLDLDVPVATYLPWLEFSSEGAEEHITLRLLMSHLSGLATEAEPYGARDAEGLERGLRDQLPELPFILPPGKLWSYSNPGINLAGHVAEAVAGQPFAELMRELVFGPLEMDATTFDPTVAMTRRLALPHERDGNGEVRVRGRFADNTLHYPSGFAISNVLDLASFATMLLNNGRFRGRQVLGRESVVEMQSKHIDRYTLEGTGYGLTLFTDHYKGVRLVGHPGSITGYMSIFTLVPARRLAVIFLCNRNAREFPAFKIVDTILDEMLELPEEAPPPIPVPSDRVVWPLYKGSYLGYQNGLATIDIAGGWLVLDMNGQVKQLKASSRDLYFAEPENEGDEPLPVGFLLEEYNGTKQVNHIVIDGVPMNRIRYDPLFQLGEATLERFAGTYRGPYTLECRVEDEQLVVRQVEKAAEAACVALDEWRLACQFGLLEFMAGDDGLVYRVQLAGTMAFDRVMGDSDE